MTDPAALEPLPENIEGYVVDTSTHSYEHRIPWGHVAVGIGLLALAYVAHQYLNDSDETPAETPEGPAEEPDGEFVNIDVQGGGLLA